MEALYVTTTSFCLLFTLADIMYLYLCSYRPIISQYPTMTLNTVCLLANNTGKDQLKIPQFRFIEYRRAIVRSVSRPTYRKKHE